MAEIRVFMPNTAHWPFGKSLRELREEERARTSAIEAANYYKSIDVSMSYFDDAPPIAHSMSEHRRLKLQGQPTQAPRPTMMQMMLGPRVFWIFWREIASVMRPRT